VSFKGGQGGRRWRADRGGWPVFPAAMAPNQREATPPDKGTSSADAKISKGDQGAGAPGRVSGRGRRDRPNQAGGDGDCWGPGEETGPGKKPATVRWRWRRRFGGDGSCSRRFRGLLCPGVGWGVESSPGRAVGWDGGGGNGAVRKDRRRRRLGGGQRRGRRRRSAFGRRGLSAETWFGSRTKRCWRRQAVGRRAPAWGAIIGVMADHYTSPSSLCWKGNAGMISG